MSDFVVVAQEAGDLLFTGSHEHCVAICLSTKVPTKIHPIESHEDICPECSSDDHDWALLGGGDGIALVTCLGCDHTWYERTET